MFLDRVGVTIEDCDHICEPTVVFHRYRRERRNQLSFEDFFLPFGGKLCGHNRWIKLAELLPWDELEDANAAQFCKGFGAPANPLRMALGACRTLRRGPAATLLLAPLFCPNTGSTIVLLGMPAQVILLWCEARVMPGWCCVPEGRPGAELRSGVSG